MNTQAAKAIKVLRDEPVRFGHLMGFDLLTDIHNEWIKEMVYSKDDYTLMAHRGSYKTTCVSIALTLISILYPNERTAFLRKTDTDVKEIIAQTQKMLAREETKLLSKYIWGIPVELTIATQGEISTNLTNDPRGSAQIIGMGMSGSLTGKHFDRIFTDDIINPKDRSSRAEREHTKLVYQELQNLKNRGGRIVNTLTPWHQDDAASLMPSPHKYDCRSTGLMTEEQIQYAKDHMEPSLFAANYELRFVPSDDVIFFSPQIGAPLSMVEGGECHVDAAYYGEDYTAFTAVQKHDGKFYVYGRIWRKHIEDVTPQIVEIVKRLRLTRLHMENNADKGYSAKAFLSLLKPEGVKVLSYHEAMVKYVKIVTYLKTAWKDIIFCDDTDPLFIDQICDYTEEAEHDDAPDSAASIFQRGKFRVKPYTPKLGEKTASATLQRQIAAVSGSSRQSYGTEKQL